MTFTERLNIMCLNDFYELTDSDMLVSSDYIIFSDRTEKLSSILYQEKINLSVGQLKTHYYENRIIGILRAKKHLPYDLMQKVKELEEWRFKQIFEKDIKNDIK